MGVTDYIVQSGDTPARIAARDDMAGCPKCSRDLIVSNPHKATVTLPNGYVTFRDLRVGEKLKIPEKWLSGELDRLSRSYFASLPHPDGITPTKPGALGDQTALDAASVKVGALAALGDQPFSDTVNDTAATVDASVSEVSGSGPPAKYATPFVQAARDATSKARQRNVDLVTAISTGDHPAAFQARVDILRYFSDALASAGLALQAFHGETPPLSAVAQAAADAITADSGYCVSVAHPRSSVNSALHAFKIAWNTANPSNSIPVGTSSYEQATADALAHVLGTAPAACAARETPPSSGDSGDWAPQDKGLGFGTILGVGLLGAGVVGGAIYLATRASSRPAHNYPIRRVPYRDDTLGPWKKI